MSVNAPEIAPSAGRLRAAALADLGGLRDRHGVHFRPSMRRRILAIGIPLVLIALAIFAMVVLNFSLVRILNGLHRLGQFAILMMPPEPQGRFVAFSIALGETLGIAFLGTLVAAVLAFPVAFLAAKNVIPNIFAHFAVRRAFDVIRSVDTLIWALMWINVVGLGPFAGVLAIACSDFGSFGKLFSEAIEATDGKAVEGVTASGGSKLHQVRFGLLPQVLPVIASQVLYFFESNTRSATIIGIVGAGGVGAYLTELIRVLELQQVAFLILMILVTVAIIDFISSKLRLAIIGKAKIV
ncbi:phosphonate ABC transporter, permease protein PhnE [Kaistia dalseonensis]|uniref:Phosphonate transport system permease protein n=1 Tax=Kaistia dalseonensis TaxID=410840 RepID=A0ABU0H8F3_9HYPH|nr:phosphonate ABC transporter, permease protein PhnE [Kaistia dalseonensis]MCX5495988.1 phosphonate ABC transporter, permease protein PhnE [Kaistia dalseonensis]MDQ0438591.1 phosphonate transport system permease protein [Kaistia dalseonensis]